MFEGTFEGHFSELTDTHQAPDPWNMGIKLEILRADHEDAKKWDADHANENGNLLEEFGQRTKREAFRQMMLNGVRDGMRKQKKLTRAEARAAEEAGPTEEEINAKMAEAESMIDKTLKDVDQEKIDALFSVSINSVKPKVAYVLLKGWSGVNEPGGVTVPFNLHNALRFVGWDGVLFEQDGKEPQFLPRTDEDGAKLNSVVNGGVVNVFTGNPRKPNGSLWMCPAGITAPGPDGKPREFGPNAAGDAITLWIVNESMLGTLAKAEVMEVAADFLADTPPGNPGTSETAQSPN